MNSLRLILPLVLTPVSAVVQATEYLSVDAAQKAIFPTADEFSLSAARLTPEQMKAIAKSSDVRVRNKDLKMWVAKKGGKTLGTFFVDDVLGKHEYITFALGISPQGEVIGVEVLTYRETYGHEVREKSWRDLFKGKTSRDQLKLDADIPNISGATLSSRHMADGIKRLLHTHEVLQKNLYAQG